MNSTDTSATKPESTSTVAGIKPSQSESPGPGRGRNVVVSLFDALVSLALVGCIALSLVGLAGRMHWLIDLTNHFKLQYLVCCTLALVWFVLRRRFGWMAVAALGVLANGLFIVPLYMAPANVNTDATGSARLRIFAANVYVGNNRTTELFQQIDSSRPDVIVISEYSADWDRLLKPLEADYPYSTKIPNKGSFGMAVYSRLEFEELEVPMTEGMTPAIAGKFAIDGRMVTVISAHPVPPTSWDYAVRRNAQLKFFGDFVSKIDGNVVVCGDLNTTRWSPWFGELTSNGLRDGTEGFGLTLTWPIKYDGFDHWLKQIQIDHCLVSKDVAVDDFRIGRSTGSDHLPIVIELAF